jgi:AraC-like DNA-binding protein
VVAALPPSSARLARDEARLWRVPFLGGLDVLQARFVKQTFARHTHEVFTVGVVHWGAAAFWNRGAEHIAPDGSVMLINPDEVNTGHSFLAAGYVHLVLYPSAEQLRQVAADLTGQSVPLPYFAQSVAQAPEVAASLTRAHQVLVNPEATRLAQDTALGWALAASTLELSDSGLRLPPLGRERVAVQLTRAYLEAHACEDVALEDLVRLTGLSGFHLTRVFRDAVGLPPHAYQVQTRIRQAQTWLRAGWAIAQVSVASGFSDQSAFSNQFKRHVGVTPGQYRGSAQTAAAPPAVEPG